MEIGNERIDLLNPDGYRIIQNPDGFCFGMDAVLLAHFAVVKEAEQVLDLGTGTGIIPLLLEYHTSGGHFTGLELQPEVADMARRSVELNSLQEKISVVTGDIREAATLFPKASFDVVTSNPPYMKAQNGLVNPDMTKAISRHEIKCTLEDVISQAAKLLKAGGRFYMVHRPRRMGEIILLLEQYGLHLRRFRTVHPLLERPANMILVEAVRGGNPQLVLEPPCVIYQSPGVYTDEVRKYYYE